MSLKRRNTSSPEPDDFPSPKRQNITGYAEDDWNSSDDEDEVEEAPRVDQYTGQTGAFPGLGDDDGQLFYGPAVDGLDYLRMVRSEARGVPYVLTAPWTRPAEINKSANINGADEGGFFEDGTYTAVAIPQMDSTDTLPPAQRHYYDSLLKHFRVVRATMRCSPPLSAIEALRSSQLISFPEESRKAREQWESHLMTADPHPTQVSCMDAQSIMELIKLTRRKLPLLLREKDVNVVKRVGAWLWAILGRCRDREELSSEEIGEIRQLAQRAVQMASKVEGNSSAETPSSNIAASESGGVEGVSDHIGDEEESVSIEEGSLSDLSHQRVVSTTLDMIITIVGEVYGQRDLLSSRTSWFEPRQPEPA